MVGNRWYGHFVVYALSIPPFLWIIFENSFEPYRGVPLNIMCSRRWLKPLLPLGSFLDPTRTNTWNVARGTFMVFHYQDLEAIIKGIFLDIRRVSPGIRIR